MKSLVVLAGLVIASAHAAADARDPASSSRTARGPVKKKKPKPRVDPTPATPEPISPEKQRADKLFEDGRNYLAAKEYALACTAFEQSHTADPAIGTLLNIALCYEEWGKIASAYRAYVEAERFAAQKQDDRAKGARQKVDELAPRVPHLVVTVPADADVSTVFLFDGKEISRAALADDVLVDPGRHEIEARVPGQPPKQTVIDLAPGERRSIKIEVPAPQVRVIVTTTPRRTGRLYGGIGLVAGGAVSIGVASFVALLARRDYADALAGCPDLRCETRADYDATQRARRRANYMTFVGAGGAVLAGAGLYLILTSAGKRTEQRVARGDGLEVVPVVGLDSVGLAVGGRL